MTTIILYTRRNVGLYALSYLKAKGYNVKVLTDDHWVSRMAKWLDVEEVTIGSMGEYDYFFSVHGVEFIPMEYLKEGKSINFHPCLSIGYKGHNPIKRYIKDKQVHATIDAHYMTNEIDEGEIIDTVSFATGRVRGYAEFYNIAVPMYYLCFEQVLLKLNIKP